MSVVEEVLLEEYDRSSRISDALEKELAGLPRGSVRKRIIKGRPYYYLQYRDGKQVRSEYVPKDALDKLHSQLIRRKEILLALKEQERSRKQIEQALGEEVIHEYSRA